VTSAWKTIAGPAAVAAACFVSVLGPDRTAHAQTNNEPVEVIRLRPNFYMLGGAGGNIGVQTGLDGVVLVDAGSQEASDRVLAVIQKLSDQPIRYILNTSADADHVGGNGKLARAGRSVFAMGPEPIGGEFARAMTNNFAATVAATENVLLRMSAPTGSTSAFPNDSWPTETFTDKRRFLYFNGEGIELFRQPSAHSDGDSIVFFRASDVIAAGDIIDTTRFPWIDLTKGGGIQGEIEALNHVLELSVHPVPFIFQEGGTYIIPGHGRVYQHVDVVEYRDMIVIIRDVIQDMIQRGLTLEEIKAASPAKPYEPQYGAKSGPWTTDNFVEAVYAGLTGKK
jgi:cyclase